MRDDESSEEGEGVQRRPSITSQMSISTLKGIVRVASKAPADKAPADKAAPLQGLPLPGAKQAVGPLHVADDDGDPRDIPKITPKTFCVITGSEDGSVKQWILPKMSRSGFGKLAEETTAGHAGKTISADDVKMTQVFGQDDGQVYRGHAAGITSISIAPPGPDKGRRIVTTSKDMTTKIWKPNGKLVCTLPNHGSDGTPGNVSAGASFRHLDYVNMAQVNSILQYDKQGRLWPDHSWQKLDSILTCSDDGKAAIWNSKTGALSCVLEKSTSGGPGEHSNFGHTEAIPMAVWSSDGRKVLTVSEDGNCIVWDVANGQDALSRRLLEHGAPVLSGAFSFGDEFVLTAALDSNVTDLTAMQGIIRLWNTNTGQEMVRWNSPDLTGTRPHGGPVLGAVWNPYNKDQFLSHAVDGTICIWDKRERVDSTRMQHGSSSAPVSTAVWAKDCILSASHDGTAMVWDLKMLESARHCLAGHSGALWQANFSGPDPQWAVTASEDTTARVWKLSKSGGKFVHSIILGENQRENMHTDAVTCAVFMEDSHHEEG